MAMIEEEIYVPKGNDFSFLEKLHTKHYGSNEFYWKPKASLVLFCWPRPPAPPRTPQRRDGKQLPRCTVASGGRIQP